MCITVNVIFIFIKLDYLYIFICIFYDKPVTDAVQQVLNPEYSFKLLIFFFYASHFILIYDLITSSPSFPYVAK